MKSIIIFALLLTACASGRGAAPHHDPLGMYDRLIDSQPGFSPKPVVPFLNRTVIIVEAFTDSVLSPTGSFLDERSEPSLENGAYYVPHLALHLTDAVVHELEQAGAVVYRSWPGFGARSPLRPKEADVRTLHVHLTHAEIHRWRARNGLERFGRAIVFDLVGAKYEYVWTDARGKVVAKGSGSHEFSASKNDDDLALLAKHVGHRVVSDLH